MVIRLGLLIITGREEGCKTHHQPIDFSLKSELLGSITKLPEYQRYYKHGEQGLLSHSSN